MHAELTDHVSYDKHDPVGNNSDNSRNGSSKNKLKGDFGEIDLETPRDRSGSFEPQIIAKNHPFTGFDDKIISMYSRGMTTLSRSDGPPGLESPNRPEPRHTSARAARSSPGTGNKAARRANPAPGRGRRPCAIGRFDCFSRSICLASLRRGSLQMERKAAATSGSLRAATTKDRSIRPPGPDSTRAKLRACWLRSSRSDPVSAQRQLGRHGRFAKRLNHHRGFVGPPAVNGGFAGAGARGDGFDGYLGESRLLHQIERGFENPPARGFVPRTSPPSTGYFPCFAMVVRQS